MATQIVPASVHADDQGTPTVPLPLYVVRAVRRFEAASARRDALAARGASTLSPAEFNSLKAAHDTIVESVTLLGAAGRLDLIAPAVTA